ncbi:Heparinase II/III-like protein [Occultella aeris]|uniref:Heparinase II/III-like protein n=1 Tax=Occultella aeris TaxID=2761496 RepID=A0A7M4DDL8_9MICO|nr:Heparinase II/III-like protein [Occultella aeris]
MSQVRQVRVPRVPGAVARAAVREDLWARRAAEEIRTHARAATARPTLADRPDRERWWHVAWDRLSDVAFSHLLEPDQALADWLRDQVAWIVDADADAWIGPGFRERESPSLGQLETAHVALALATVLEIAPDAVGNLRERAVQALRTKALGPCERWLRRRDEHADGGGRLNNWYVVLLDGQVAAALHAGGTEDLDRLPARLQRVHDLFETDSYGESLQYWGYAARHATELHARLTGWLDPSGGGDAVAGLDRADLDRLLLEPLARCLPWVAASLTAHSDPATDRMPGAVNLGDSARTWRPPAEVLAAVSRRPLPHAGLASWLLERCYPESPVPLASELSTFGFFNRAGWRAVLDAPGRVPAVAPGEAARAVTYTAGTTVVRTDWSTVPETLVALQTGHDALRAASHRHADVGSFVLVRRGVSLLADAGHCTYRLAAYRDATAATSHSTWTFSDPSGPIEQHQVTAVPGRPEPGEVAALGQTPLGPLRSVGVDVASAYDAPISTARRTWHVLVPHVVVVVDEITADRPVEMHTRFVTDNSDDDLSTHVATGSRVVIRRRGQAAKILRLDARTDGAESAAPVVLSATALHDVYDPLPLAPGQGREGSGVVQTFSTAGSGRTHRAVYAIIADDEPRIRGWHAHIEDDRAVISSPEGTVVEITVGRSVPTEVRSAERRGQRLAPDLAMPGDVPVHGPPVVAVAGDEHGAPGLPATAM